MRFLTGRMGSNPGVGVDLCHEVETWLTPCLLIRHFIIKLQLLQFNYYTRWVPRTFDIRENPAKSVHRGDL